MHTFPQEKQRTGMIMAARAILMDGVKEMVVCASTLRTKRKIRLSAQS